MTDPGQPALEIPGLEPTRETDSAMVRACRTTIAALDSEGKLRTAHAVLTQLMLSLAEAIDGGRRSGRASAVAMASKELRETLLMLDPPDEGEGGADALTRLKEFIDAVEREANSQAVEPGAWQHTCLRPGDEATCPGCLARAAADDVPAVPPHAD